LRFIGHCIRSSHPISKLILWELNGNYRCGGAAVKTYPDILVEDLIETNLINEVQLMTRSKLSKSKHINTQLIIEIASKLFIKQIIEVGLQAGHACDVDDTTVLVL